MPDVLTNQNKHLTFKRLLVFGSTGMLGQALVSTARRRHIDVLGAARRNADICVDITDNESIKSAIVKANPDVVINAAAITNLEYCEKNPLAAYLVNASAVATLVNCCQRASIKFIQISTDHYYRNSYRQLHAEDDPVVLLNHYAKTKFAGEMYAATAFESLIIRTNIVGFRNWSATPTFIEWAIQALENNEKITLFTDFFTSSIDTKTCAESIFDLTARGARGTFNIAARDCISKADFIMLLAKRLGLSTGHCRLGFLEESSSTVARANSLGLDVGLVESILGRRMPSTEDVIHSLVELRENNK